MNPAGGLNVRYHLCLGQPENTDSRISYGTTLSYAYGPKTIRQLVQDIGAAGEGFGNFLQGMVDGLRAKRAEIEAEAAG